VFNAVGMCNCRAKGGEENVATSLDFRCIKSTISTAYCLFLPFCYSIAQIIKPTMPFQTINSTSIFYTITPPSPAKSITLFIHGLGSSSCFYLTIIPSLSSISQCIALDTPGSGLSSLPEGDQSIQSIADTAVALLDALKIETVFVVGHSMGGIVASYLAAEYPGRVKGVVLLGPVAPAPALAGIFEQRIEMIKTGMFRI